MKNLEINKKAIKELETLKKKQELLEAQIKEQEELTELDVKKTKAIEEAKIRLANRVDNHNKALVLQKAFAKKLTTYSPAVLVENIDKEFTLIPKVWLTGGNQWRGETIITTVKTIKVSYMDIEIELVDASGPYDTKVVVGATLPYNVVDTMRTYKSPKTIIDKIDTFKQDNQDKLRRERKQFFAYKRAEKNLKDLCPEGTEVYVYEDYKNQTYSHYIYDNEIVIIFNNGNQIRYRVSSSANEKGYFLKIQSTKDLKMDEIKKNPDTLINHLK